MRLAAKEWRLLARNPNALGTLFLMPAIFVLVMSFTLKNTLIARIDLPKAGWVVEDTSPAAARWTSDWLAQHGGERFASREALQAALKSRRVEAGVIVRAPWLGKDGRPQGNQVEMWLGNRVQPAAAARLRAELGFSMAQVQVKIAAAEAGSFASVLLGNAGSSELLPEKGSPVIRYLYEIESGRAMTAVQQSVPAWLVFGMFFVVIPVAGVLIQERNDGTLTRLATFDVPVGATLCGKLLAYMLLNWGQLALMVIVGHWLVPLLGGDALELGISPWWFLVMIVATSIARRLAGMPIICWYQSSIVSMKSCIFSIRSRATGEMRRSRRASSVQVLSAATAGSTSRSLRPCAMRVCICHRSSSAS